MPRTVFFREGVDGTSITTAISPFRSVIRSRAITASARVGCVDAYRVTTTLNDDPAAEAHRRLLDAVADAELEASGFSAAQIAAIRARAAQLASLAPLLEQPAFGGV